MGSRLAPSIVRNLLAGMLVLSFGGACRSDLVPSLCLPGGCGDVVAPVDLARGDSSPPEDLARVDLAMPDLAMPDLAVVDLAMPDLVDAALDAGPPECVHGLDPGTMSPWVLCAMDSSTAWVSSRYGGKYHALLICQQLGFARVSAQGGNCGDTCAFCEKKGASCLAPGKRSFDAAGDCGSDALGPLLCSTVMWECAH